MIISTNEANPNALKLVIAAKLARQPFVVRLVNPADALLGRLPTLEVSSESTLFSISSALRFLLPVSEESEVLDDSWLEWEITQLQPAILSHALVKIPKSLQKSDLWSLLKDLNSELKNKQYLIEERSNLSPADISIWVSLWGTVLLEDVKDNIAKELPNLYNWFINIEKQSIIQESLKEFNLERGAKAIASIEAASWFPVNAVSNSRLNEAVSSDASPKEKDPEAVSQDELHNVASNWTTGQYQEVKESAYPILPKKDERNILITSALPYVNNVPHLGNIIGCVLSADIFARYCRQRNYNTLYISGTDEYGTATEAKALQEKTTPQAICDKFFDIHNDVYRWFGIGFDYFGRTTSPEQTEIAQSFFLKIKSRGYVTSETVEQLHCESCDRFLADRFVEGTCPGCKYEDARGDQCDGCSHLVNAVELINPRCKMCSTRPIIKNSIQFFLDLPQIEERLKEYTAAVEKGWSNVARVVTRSWLRDGLKPRCITRDLKWGIPVPVEGFENKVFYVWFDAPFGYISITKRYTKEYKKWWQPQQDTRVDLYQFMAKDNVPFHTIMFPACLLAVNENYTLMKHLMATEYLNYEDKKFSKSRGVGVFGTHARDTGIPADVWRFYLAYIRPETQDSNFNWVDLATKNNSELLNNLGNFVNRALVFSEKFFNSSVPPIEQSEEDWTLLALVQRELSSYINAMEQAKLRDGLKHILAISKHGNQYMQSQQPWVKVKGAEDDKKKAGTVVGICCNLACLLSALLAPFMPATSKQVRSQLGLSNASYGYIPDTLTNMLPTWHKIGKPTPLFTKIEDQTVETLRKRYGGQQEVNGEGSARDDESTLNDQNNDEIASLEAAITTQGNLVRQLKATCGKKVWQPEVNVLLGLKEKLAKLKGIDNAPEKKPPAKKSSAKKKAEPKQVLEQNGDAMTDGNLDSVIAKIDPMQLNEGGSRKKLQTEPVNMTDETSVDVRTSNATEKKSRKKK